MKVLIDLVTKSDDMNSWDLKHKQIPLLYDWKNNSMVIGR